MPPEKPSVIPLFGELLIGADLITPADLRRCIEFAFDKGPGLSDVLISEGYLDHRVFMETIRLQRLIRHGGLDVRPATKFLTEVVKKKRDLIAVLLDAGWYSYKLAYLSELGRLLLESEVVDGEPLALAVTHALRDSLPLGSYLLKERMITEITLWSALKSLPMSDSGRIPRDKMIEYFKTAVLKQRLPEFDFSEAEESKRRGEWIRLGELFVTSGIISETEILAVLEGAMELGIPLGKFLVSQKVLTPVHVQRALDIQTLVSTGQLSPSQAGGVAKQVLTLNLPVSDAVRKVRETAEHVKPINLPA